MTKHDMIEKAFKICEQNKQLFTELEISEFNQVCKEVKKELYAIKLQEDYGIHNINRNMIRQIEPEVYIEIGNYMHIASMGEKYRRTISWSVDGSQPDDEVMFVISFPTGAYIFGDSYPVKLFEEMWAELKSYKFKYVDDMNHNIYFSLDETASIANVFRKILNKYYEKYRSEAKIRRMDELRCELEKLEENAV